MTYGALFLSLLLVPCTVASQFDANWLIGSMLLEICTNLLTKEKAEIFTVSNIALGVTVAGLITAVAVENSTISESSKLSDKDKKRRKNIVQAALAVSIAALCVYAFDKLYPIAQDIRLHAFPTAEERAAREARTIASRERLKLLETEQAFRKCLLNAKHGDEINGLGRPTACEEMAQMLEKLGAKAKVDEMTDTFNYFFPNRK